MLKSRSFNSRSGYNRCFLFRKFNVKDVLPSAKTKPNKDQSDDDLNAEEDKEEYENRGGLNHLFKFYLTK